MPTFYNLDNNRAEVTSYLNGLDTALAEKWATPTPGAVVADVTITTDLTGVDTGTDMTAAQAAQIETDLAALATAVNTLISRLEALNLLAAE